MSPHDDKPVSVPQELERAYRALPAAAPSEAVDAGVRAAVNAELDRSLSKRGLLAGLRQHVPLAPLATAATVLVAVVVGYLAWPQHRIAVATRTAATAPHEPAAPPAVRVPEAQAVSSSALSADSLAVVRSSKPPPPPLQAPVLINMPIASAPAAPPPKAQTAPEPEPTYATPQDGTLNEMVVVTGARESASKQSGRASEKSRLVQDAAPVTLDDVRALLREGKPEAARKLLRHWKSQNPEATLPEDLQALLNDNRPP